MDTSLVSIITASDGAKPGENTAGLDSVLSQTYENIQVILVCRDGGSPADDPRLEVCTYSGDGSGVDLWNYGRTFAKGSYVALYRYGDVWDPHKIGKQVSCLQEYPEDAACFTWTSDDSSRLRNRTRESWAAAAYTGTCRPDPYTSLVSADGRTVLFDPAYQQGFLLEWYLRLLSENSIRILEENLDAMPAAGADKTEDAPHLQAEVQRYNESAHIFGRWINTMDKEFFAGSFRGIFRNGESSSDLEISCEKAFLLLELPGSGTLSEQGMVRLGSLLCEEESRELLKQKYNFTQHDYYEMMKHHIYFDPILQKPLLAGYTEEAEMAAAAEMDEEAAQIYEKESARLSGELEEDRKNRVTEKKHRQIELLTREIEREHRKYKVLKQLLHGAKQLFMKTKA